jgi:hypothetical protein
VAHAVAWELSRMRWRKVFPNTRCGSLGDLVRIVNSAVPSRHVGDFFGVNKWSCPDSQSSPIGEVNESVQVDDLVVFFFFFFISR